MFPEIPFVSRPWLRSGYLSGFSLHTGVCVIGLFRVSLGLVGGDLRAISNLLYHIAFSRLVRAVSVK